MVIVKVCYVYSTVLLNKVGKTVAINFDKFDESAVLTLKRLAQYFPAPAEVGFNDLFPEFEGDIEKRASHIGTLAFLRHENIIAHEVGSSSSFIITRTGLSLFNEDIFQHLKYSLNNEADNI